MSASRESPGPSTTQPMTTTRSGTGKPGADRTDTTTVLSAGEHHRTDTIRRPLTGLTARTTTRPNRIGSPRQGARKAHLLPIPDQYMPRQTLGAPAATARLCSGSRVSTTLPFPLYTRLSPHL